MNNKILLKQFYYRYYNKYICASYLGLYDLAKEASLAMCRIEKTILANNHLMILSNFCHLMPPEIETEFEEFITKGKIESEHILVNQIPEWVLSLIRYEFIDSTKLAYFNKRYACSSLEDLIQILEAKNHIKEQDFLNKLIFYKRSKDEILKDKAIVDSWSELDDSSSLSNDYIIRGLLHNHTTFSDGMLDHADYFKSCHDFGLEYIGISDHSGLSLSGITEKELIRQSKIIDELNNNILDIKLLKGLECEIDHDGSLDIKSDIADELDYLIVGVHRYRSQSQKENYNMLIKAIENPLTDILAHPCARTLSSHPGLMIDIRKIIDACVANNVIIECNLSEKRIDLPLEYIDYAIDRGAKLLLSTDTHRTEHFNRLLRANQLCSRLKIPKQTIINALSSESILKYFHNVHKIKR